MDNDLLPCVLQYVAGCAEQLCLFVNKQMYKHTLKKLQQRLAEFVRRQPLIATACNEMNWKIHYYDKIVPSVRGENETLENLDTVCYLGEMVSPSKKMLAWRYHLECTLAQERRNDAQEGRVVFEKIPRISWQKLRSYTLHTKYGRCTKAEIVCRLQQQFEKNKQPQILGEWWCNGQRHVSITYLKSQINFWGGSADYHFYELSMALKSFRRAKLDHYAKG